MFPGELEMSHFSCIDIAFSVQMLFKNIVGHIKRRTKQSRKTHIKSPWGNFLNIARVAFSIFLKSTFKMVGKHQKILCGRHFWITLKISVMYQSIPSLTIPPGDPRGFAHSSCPRGRVFAPLSCPGICPGGCSGGS